MKNKYYLQYQGCYSDLSDGSGAYGLYVRNGRKLKLLHRYKCEEKAKSKLYQLRYPSKYKQLKKLWSTYIKSYGRLMKFGVLR